MKVRELLSVLEGLDPNLDVAVTNDGWFETCDDISVGDRAVHLGPILGRLEDHNCRVVWYDGPITTPESAPAS